MDPCATSDLLCLRNRQITMARVGHLVKRKQQELDRIVRILRAEFVAERRRSPKHGMITSIFLVGRYAERATPDRETGLCNVYEMWVVVDRQEFRGLEKTWGPARELIRRELRGRCTVELSVFDAADFARAISDNVTIREKAETAILLYDTHVWTAASQIGSAL